MGVSVPLISVPDWSVVPTWKVALAVGQLSTSNGSTVSQWMAQTAQVTRYMVSIEHDVSMRRRFETYCLRCKL